MNKNYKKLLKLCAIGGSIYALLELSYLLGKGHMLGLMLAHDINPNEVMETLSKYQGNIRLYANSRFIELIAMKKVIHETKMES